VLGSHRISSGSQLIELIFEVSTRATPGLQTIFCISSIESAAGLREVPKNVSYARIYRSNTCFNALVDTQKVQYIIPNGNRRGLVNWAAVPEVGAQPALTASSLVIYSTMGDYALKTPTSCIGAGLSTVSCSNIRAGSISGTMWLIVSFSSASATLAVDVYMAGNVRRILSNGRYRILTDLTLGQTVYQDIDATPLTSGFPLNNRPKIVNPALSNPKVAVLGTCSRVNFLACRFSPVTVSTRNPQVNIWLHDESGFLTTGAVSNDTTRLIISTNGLASIVKKGQTSSCVLVLGGMDASYVPVLQPTPRNITLELSSASLSIQVNPFIPTNLRVLDVFLILSDGSNTSVMGNNTGLILTSDETQLHRHIYSHFHPKFSAHSNSKSDSLMGSVCYRINIGHCCGQSSEQLLSLLPRVPYLSHVP